MAVSNFPFPINKMWTKREVFTPDAFLAPRNTKIENHKHLLFQQTKHHKNLDVVPSMLHTVDDTQFPPHISAISSAPM